MNGTTTVTGSTLRVPDGELYFERRGSGPLVVLVGAPMDAHPFAGLADLLAPDHTILTTDPRGINRSRLDDPERDSTPEQRADDLARLIRHADAGPAVVLGSSGGAVSALALAQAEPGLCRVVIAHEPPLTRLLDDHEDLRAKTEDIIATHRAGDPLAAGRKFLALANLDLPEEFILEMFGSSRTPQEVADADYQNNHMLRPTTAWFPDLDALRASPVRLLVGLGEDSTGELCERTSVALAAALSTTPTYFPGGHVGFAEDPTAFAARLREVIAG
ncbi:alpha/beta fold hydrolase [Actinokineospora spheciospongiae]|uniref:alpha/beta fold hydrolase n=1 Tax=Actinokineospora spheciospongiae TaxID=909613 RepID=UPI000D71CEAE|nr:alpha/beta hydrolase [Actinokineospora spheciospongiae]PWW56976.1 pimeloyl-ACP methyl ester carboxylesterase [Actinokineospora spheciospongiae]